MLKWLVDCWMVPDERGRIVFYPWGLFGKGYVANGPENEATLRNFLKHSFVYSFLLPASGLTLFPLVFLFSPAALWIVVFWLILMVLLGLGFLFWFCRKTEQVVVGLETVPKISFIRHQEHLAKITPTWILWCLLGPCIPLLGASLLMFYRHRIMEGVAMLLLFGLAVAQQAHIAILKGRLK